MAYYRCVKEPEIKNEEESNLNSFITYTFGNKATRFRRQWYDGSSNSYYDAYGEFDPYNLGFGRYHFHIGYIYESDGMTIKDDSGIIHNFDGIKDCFFEVNIELDDATNELIKLKRKKGAKITIKPLMMDMRSYKIIYHIGCNVMTKNGRCFSSTWDEDTDVYNSIVNCFKKLRKGTLSGYHHKIKEVLEKQKDERIRKYT